MNREAKRIAAESRLEAAGSRRVELEGELGEKREATTKLIRECAGLGSKKSTIARLARVDRSRVYQVLES